MLGQRLRDHQAEARYSRDKNHRLNLLRSLKQSPTMELIEETADEGGAASERRWIALAREYGCRLVNGTDGGDGGDTISNHSERALICAKIGAAQKGKVRSKECCKKISESNRRREVSDASREKNRNAHLGKRMSAEACAKVSRSLIGNQRRRGKKSSEAARKKQSLAALGVKRGPYREKGRVVA